MAESAVHVRVIEETLTKSPAVSIAKIRSCVRGVSSKFVLACYMRFASRENTRLGHPEVGVGLHPGGGGTERLPHLGCSSLLSGKMNPASKTVFGGHCFMANSCPPVTRPARTSM